jgi:hypothetical protein
MIKIYQLNKNNNGNLYSRKLVINFIAKMCTWVSDSWLII